MFYLISFVLISICGIHYYRYPNSAYYRDVLCILFVFFIYVAGMRYNLGVDYFAYERAFIESDTLIDLNKYSSFSDFRENNRWELGFTLLFITIRSFTSNVLWLFLLSSVICTICLFKSLRCFSEKPYFILSLLTYFCSVYLLQEMQALRQALAAGFLFISFAKYYSGNRIKSLAWLVVAILFHNSAPIFLIFFFFYNHKFKLSTQLISVGISLLLIVFQIPWLAEIVLVSTPIFPEGESVAKLLKYFSDSTLNNTRGIYITYFLYLFVFFTSLYANRKRGYYPCDPKLIFAQNLLFFYLVFSAATWEINYISTRIGWYLLFGVSIYLPHLIDYFNRESRGIILCFIIIFNFMIIRPFVFPTITTSPFSPYDDYISCKIFGKKSTGRERADKYASEMGVVLSEI